MNVNLSFDNVRNPKSITVAATAATPTKIAPSSSTYTVEQLQRLQGWLVSNPSGTETVYLRFQNRGTNAPTSSTFTASVGRSWTLDPNSSIYLDAASVDIYAVADTQVDIDIQPVFYGSVE